MLGNYCRKLGDYVCRRQTQLLVNLGVQSWVANLCAVVSAFASAYFFYYHNVLPALLFLVLNGVFDYMDGAISRTSPATVKISPRYKVIFHVFSDKLSDVLIFSGMVSGKLVSLQMGVFVIISGLTLTILGRWLQHEGLFTLERSLFDRTDQLVVLLIFCSLKFFTLALIVVSILNGSGIVQRIYSALNVPPDSHNNDTTKKN